MVEEQKGSKVPEVVVVGGGLAGMVAALRLVECGFRVSIYEASQRLGGKAGANKSGNDYDEHGYHIFPAFYLNTWRLVDDLGIRENFFDCTDLVQLQAGEFPRVKILRNMTSVRYFLRNLFSGVVSVPEMFLFYYSILDLMTQPYRYRARLDQVSITGFLRSRFYRTESLASMSQELILKGISVPSYRVSAMTMRILMQYWLKYPLPIFRMLRGNLQEFFVEPIKRKLVSKGCQIYVSQRLEKLIVNGSRITRLQFLDQANERMYERAVESIILAIPSEKVMRLIDDDLYRAAPGLSGIRSLNGLPMAALNIYLSSKINGMPAGLVNLIDSRFGLSLVDMSQAWQSDKETVLNVIAAYFTPLEGLSEPTAKAEILAEIRRYLPGLEPSNIRRIDFQSHIEEPLFMNDVGAWEFRPVASTAIPNLYLAGDYCRSHIDLVSMEGAITTGLQAAEAVRKNCGMPKPVEILRPAVHPRWILALPKIGLIPVAALAKLAMLLRA